MDIDSGNESDGENAMRTVEARDQPKAARRGPLNASMRHFYEPTAIVDGLGTKRWEFQCRHCAWYGSISLLIWRLLMTCAVSGASQGP